MSSVSKRDDKRILVQSDFVIEVSAEAQEKRALRYRLKNTGIGMKKERRGHQTYMGLIPNKCFKKIDKKLELSLEFFFVTGVLGN